LLRLGSRARGALRLGCWFFLRRRRRRGRLPIGAFLRHNGLDARDVPANLPHPRGILELPRRALKAQVEPLLLELEYLVVELVDGHGTKIIRLHRYVLDLALDALDEASLDRQLGGGEPERLARARDRHTVDLEQDPSRLDAGHPQLGSSL